MSASKCFPAYHMHTCTRAVNAEMHRDEPFLHIYGDRMDDDALDYVRRVMRETGLDATGLARMAGLSSTTLTRPLNEGSGHKYKLSRRTIETIEAATGIPYRVIGMSEDEPAFDAPVPVGNGDTPPNGSKLVPVYDVAASAGHGAYAEYESVAYSLAFPPSYLRKLTRSSPQTLAIISVKGDSMEPTLLDDDIVLLDSSKTSLDFDGLFVLRFGQALHIKRIGRSPKPGHVTVISDNKAEYPAIEYETGAVHVIGKVLWYGRKV